MLADLNKSLSLSVCALFWCGFPFYCVNIVVLMGIPRARLLVRFIEHFMLYFSFYWSTYSCFAPALTANFSEARR